MRLERLYFKNPIRPSLGTYLVWDHYEIMIPVAEDQAHLPPEGYHTFYLNHLEMGLRFPVPRFIQNLCDHLKEGVVGIAICLGPRSRREGLLLYPHRRVEVEGDLGIAFTSLSAAHPIYSLGLSNYCSSCATDTIMKAQLLKAYKKQESGATKSPSTPPKERAKEKRKMSSSGGDKRPRKKTPSVVNFAPEVDLPVVSSASDQAITEALAANFMQALLCGGELSRVSNALEIARSSRRSLDEVMIQHDKPMREIEEGIIFEQGFNGCLAQFRANGYSETEHPTPFLSVLKALEDLPEEGEVGSSSAPEK
ncbi:hypothetical protein F511_24141 [Dorcoceras hygrometricum]|uniref:Uncharacterized protein n=1 Tax=Dorcoceras hygrometricum TaxID=472368 RepID=A0A2Z7B9F0_9LAMI|nr:hypothetical protein F511_24141 [Dorcoceras hygrometricum]